MYKYPNGDKVTTNNSECGNPIATKLPECDGISQIYLSSGLQVQKNTRGLERCVMRSDENHKDDKRPLCREGREL